MSDPGRAPSRWLAPVGPGRRTAVALLTLAIGVGAFAPAASGEAVAPPPVGPVINAAKATLSTALMQLRQGQYPDARTSLSMLRTQLTDAHNLGMSPLRPGRAIPVLDLEHEVLLALLPPFNGLTRTGVVSSLQSTLWTALANRTVMLKAIVALPEEGAGGSFDDDMADTLPEYGAEVQRYTAALGQFQLTAAARDGLTKDLTRIRANQKLVRQRFGGGE
jgi:hypothetical protein